MMSAILPKYLGQQLAVVCSTQQFFIKQCNEERTVKTKGSGCCMPPLCHADGYLVSWLAYSISWLLLIRTNTVECAIGVVQGSHTTLHVCLFGWSELPSCLLPLYKPPPRSLLPSSFQASNSSSSGHLAPLFVLIEKKNPSAHN